MKSFQTHRKLSGLMAPIFCVTSLFAAPPALGNTTHESAAAETSLRLTRLPGDDLSPRFLIEACKLQNRSLSCRQIGLPEGHSMQDMEYAIQSLGRSGTYRLAGVVGGAVAAGAVMMTAYGAAFMAAVSIPAVKSVQSAIVFSAMPLVSGAGVAAAAAHVVGLTSQAAPVSYALTLVGGQIAISGGAAMGAYTYVKPRINPRTYFSAQNALVNAQRDGQSPITAQHLAALEEALLVSASGQAVIDRGSIDTSILSAPPLSDGPGLTGSN